MTVSLTELSVLSVLTLSRVAAFSLDSTLKNLLFSSCVAACVCVFVCVYMRPGIDGTPGLEVTCFVLGRHGLIKRLCNI